MREHEPGTQTINVAEGRQNLDDLLNQVVRREPRVPVMKRGIPVAGLVQP